MKEITTICDLKAMYWIIHDTFNIFWKRSLEVQYIVTLSMKDNKLLNNGDSINYV